MADYNYNDEFETISGVIYGSVLDTQFKAVETAVNSKGNIADQSWTGTHTFNNVTVNGTIDIDGGTY